MSDGSNWKDQHAMHKAQAALYMQRYRDNREMARMCRDTGQNRRAGVLRGNAEAARVAAAHERSKAAEIKRLYLSRPSAQPIA